MKKLQVFISSTYDDLKEERQAAVQAILRAGHIPAGMELFAAGDESQMRVIERWIENSDVFLLILGSRYGSIEPKTKLSYVEREFNHALKLKKPLFSVVMNTSEVGRRQVAIDRPVAKPSTQYTSFRQRVTSFLCAFFSDVKDIQLAIHNKLPELMGNTRVSGWISAKEILPMSALIEQSEKLKIANAALRDKLAQFENDDAKVRRLRFLATDYVKHMIDKHGIRADSCVTAFAQARSVEDLSKRVRAAAPRATTCEFFAPRYMKYQFLGMTNLSRQMLDLDCFNRSGEADANIRNRYIGVPGVGNPEPNRKSSSKRREHSS
jgi:Domain of unknown function (DUF4062)